MTRLIAQELDKREIGFEYLYGGVPSAKRKDLVDNFMNEPSSRVFRTKDEKTGETTIRIPVESRETVANLFGLIGNLFAK